jgi:hypothetical protein
VSDSTSVAVEILGVPIKTCNGCGEREAARPVHVEWSSDGFLAGLRYSGPGHYCRASTQPTFREIQLYGARANTGADEGATWVFCPECLKRVRALLDGLGAK